MVTPTARRDAAEFLVEGWEVSVQRACGLAARREDVALVLVQAGGVLPESECSARDEDVPLQMAVDARLTNVVKALLAYGVDINWHVGCETPLRSAIDSADKGIVVNLLEAGALPNWAPQGCETPLHYAYVSDSWPIFRTLLQHGGRMSTNRQEWSAYVVGPIRSNLVAELTTSGAVIAVSNSIVSGPVGFPEMGLERIPYGDAEVEGQLRARLVAAAKRSGCDTVLVTHEGINSAESMTKHLLRAIDRSHVFPVFQAVGNTAQYDWWPCAYDF